MKTIQEVSSDKLRGGFYTPHPLVDVCLNRVMELSHGRENLSILEPSVGDGAFLRGLAAHPLCSCVERFVGIELVEAEAQKCRQVAQSVPFECDILTTSALDWVTTTDKHFDAVVGNPPFVRFQFVSKSDLNSSELLGRRLGLTFRGVSNLWIPILLGALSRLRIGGAMAMVVPAEIFTGYAAGEARTWLLSNFDELRIDMFEPGSFPDVLQEVVVLSGRRIETAASASLERAYLQFIEHLSGGITLRWAHLIPKVPANWTHYLLTPAQLDALATAQNLSSVQRLGDIAKFEVGIVTGANDFFSVDNRTLAQFDLHAWAQPLLPRTRHADDLIYALEDHETTASSEAKAWLLDFSRERPNPLDAVGASTYLRLGEQARLNLRYKTSIRTPWYRVPSVWSAKLMLSKRSHRFPRLILNAAGVVTTDTIYRGKVFPLYEGRELDLVAAFHNSLTLLTVELEGRSFGGGVLELVPSEISRLSIPFPVSLYDCLPKLRAVARRTAPHPEDQELLVDETDKLLAQRLPELTSDLLYHLRQARHALLTRRLSRN